MPGQIPSLPTRQPGGWHRKSSNTSITALILISGGNQGQHHTPWLRGSHSTNHFRFQKTPGKPNAQNPGAGGRASLPETWEIRQLLHSSPEGLALTAGFQPLLGQRISFSCCKYLSPFTFFLDQLLTHLFPLSFPDISPPPVCSKCLMAPPPPKPCANKHTCTQRS